MENRIFPDHTLIRLFKEEDRRSQYPLRFILESCIGTGATCVAYQAEGEDGIPVRLKQFRPEGIPRNGKLYQAAEARFLQAYRQQLSMMKDEKTAAVTSGLYGLYRDEMGFCWTSVSRRSKRSFFSVVVLALVLAFLYVPIILVVVYGFIPNGISMSFFDSAGQFTGFTGKWYAMIFSGDMRLGALMQSFWLSLVVAGLATLVSCAIGTTSALALHKWRGRLQSIHHALVYTPLIMPDILIGISLLMLFVACSVDCGFWTILIAHVTFCVSYVVMTILARLQDFDDRLIEAAYDLGAGHWYTFFHVQLPILMPGIIAGGLLAFTLSIDDVVITSFVNGAGTNTFPTYVSSMTKHSRNLPAVFALSTLMLLFTCVLVGLSKLIARGQQQKTKGK